MSKTLKIYYDGKSKKITQNNNKIPSLFGIMPSIIYSPKDIFLASLGPATRRRFLNIQIAQHDLTYIQHLIRFHKALKKRNIMLKGKITKNIEIWENEMAKSGAYVTYARSKIISLLEKNINE